MKTDISMEALKKDAAWIFHNGYACSESVIYAVNKHLDLGISENAIAMSSGFPWGLGGGACLCGALAGATMCIGAVYGRKFPGDPGFEKCQELTKEMYEFFIQTCGGSCCRVLTKGYERNSPERKDKCETYVTAAAEKTAEILIREYERTGKKG